MSYWCKNIDEALDRLMKAGYEYRVGRRQLNQTADVFVYNGDNEYELYVELQAADSVQVSFDKLMAVVQKNAATPDHWMAL